jgi:hypothetical protein
MNIEDIITEDIQRLFNGMKGGKASKDKVKDWRDAKAAEQGVSGASERAPIAPGGSLWAALAGSGCAQRGFARAAGGQPSGSQSADCQAAEDGIEHSG